MAYNQKAIHFARRIVVVGTHEGEGKSTEQIERVGENREFREFLLKALP